VEDLGLRVDIDSVELVGPDGRGLVDNGEFSRGMARWFMVSEKIHLPWHIKNLAFNVLFDQGMIGLALFALMVGGALWRLCAGHARGHPMAPFIAAALVGFLVVGAFDSLLDVPRLALVFYLVLIAGLALEKPARLAPPPPV
jgi:O-antigen ligase